MSWLEEWQEESEVRLFLGSLDRLPQNYELDSSQPKARRREKEALNQFLKMEYPNSEIIKDQYGKPHFKNKQPHINYSHSQSHFLWGEHAEFPIGVDVETERPQLLKVAHKFCNDVELEYTVNGKNLPLLLAIWSAKESMFKAFGTGAVDFKEHMQIEPFELSDKGSLQATFRIPETRRLTIFYRRFNTSICTWTLWR